MPQRKKQSLSMAQNHPSLIQKFDMKLLKKIYNKINPPPIPKYGKNIFASKSWLEKQVEDAMFRQAKNQINQIR